MALLPYEQTYAVDMTRGITAATPPASLNIASLIVADTGPVDRVTLTSQKDLVDTFCVGSAISATDNETIQFNGALLTQVATDVFRVDTSAMRIGIGSTGSKIFFDKDFTLLDKVTRAKIGKGDTQIQTLTIELQRTDDSVAKFYMGTVPEGDNWVRVGEEDEIPDIDKFFQYLYEAGVFLSITPTSAILNPVYDKVINFDESKDTLGDIGNVSIDSFSNVMNKYTANETPEVKQYSLTINSIFTICPNNSSQEGTAVINAADPNGGLDTAYNINNFLVKALDVMYSDESIPDPWAENVKITFTKTVTLEDSDLDIFDIPAPLASLMEVDQGAWNENTRTATITVNNGTTLIDKYSGNTIRVLQANGEYKAYNVADFIGETYNIHTLQGLILSIAEIEDKDDDTNVSYTITDEADGAPYFLINSLSSTSIAISDSIMITGTLADPTNYQRLNHATSETNDQFKTEDKLFIIVDNYVFYAGTKPTEEDIEEAIDDTDDWMDDGYGSWEYVVVSKAHLSISDFLKAVVSKIGEVFTVGTGMGGFFLISGTHDFECSNNLKITEELVIDQSKYEDEFAVVCRFTSSKPVFQFEYDSNDDEYNTINLTYKFKDITGNFTMSFIGEAIDGYGKSLYYDNYNEGSGANSYIYIAKLDGDKRLKHGGSNGFFGDEVLNNTPTEADYAAAILKYLDVKEKQYNFVTDAGHMSVALAGACKRVADERFCQYVPSFPPKKNVNDLLGYMEGINLNDFRCQYLVPSHKSTYNGQFLTTVPASLTYMFARVNAFNTTVAEFSPLFGTIKGAATAPNLIKNFTNAEAQKLADQNINVITRDVSGIYIRSNFTSQKENSYLSEDQNVYMTNILCHICEEYNPLIIAELNTAELRGRVVADLSNRIQQRMIVGKNPTIAGYLVKCDEELNTPEVIEARQLIYQVWVQYTPSIAYVLAYVFVKRLGSF